MSVAETGRQKAGAYLSVTTWILPGMLVSGFLPEWDVLSPLAYIAIAAVGGLAGGALWDEVSPLRGAICGAVTGAGALIAVPVYVGLRSSVGDTYFTLELVLAGLVGSLPGIGLYKLLERAQESAGEGG